MTMHFATRLALAGVLAALAFELVWSWYFQDLLLTMVKNGALTTPQVYVYHRVAATIKSLLQNGTLAYFFYSLQSRTYCFGEYQ